MSDVCTPSEPCYEPGCEWCNVPVDDAPPINTSDPAGAAGPSPWTPLSREALQAAIDKEDIPPPTLLPRTDGVHLLYPRRVHWFQGESESLKSWLVQLAVALALLADRRVAYIDFEDDEYGVMARLIALGVPADTLLDPTRFLYWRPDERLYNRQGVATGGLAALNEACGKLAADGVIDVAAIDGVTEAMTTEGLNPLDNVDIATWLRRLPKHLALDYGAAVPCLDHVVKNADARGRYALGGVHKLNGVTGCTYTVTATRPLSRATHDPVTGTSTIKVEKDRPGWVRSKMDANRIIAVLEVTSYPDGGVSARLLPPDEAADMSPPWSVCARILGHLDTYAGASKRSVTKDVAGKEEANAAAVKWMIGEGWISVRESGTTHKHYLTDDGRQALKSDNQPPDPPEEETT